MYFVDQGYFLVVKFMARAALDSFLFAFLLCNMMESLGVTFLAMAFW